MLLLESAIIWYSIRNNTQSCNSQLLGVQAILLTYLHSGIIPKRQPAKQTETRMSPPLTVYIHKGLK